jgi:AsmA protein
LNIQDARIEFQDQQAGSHYLLSGFSMQTGALGDGKPVTLELTTLLEDLAAGTRAKVDLAATVAIDLQAEQYTFDEVELTMALGTSGAPGDALAIRIRAPRVSADLAAQILQMESFTAQLAGLEADGALSARNILDDPSFSGSLSVAEFSPAELMQAMQLEAPVTADPEALQRARLSTSFEGNSSSIKLSDFEFELDQSRFIGEMSLRDFDHPRIGFDFTVDEIDIDRYLEPATDRSTDQAARADVAMPREELQDQDVQGTLRAGKMRLAGLDFSDATLGLTIRNGKLRLNPITAGFYGGTYSGDITLDSSGPVPVLSLDEKVDSITFQQLVADLVDNESLSGTALGHVSLTGRGASSSEVMRSLNGDLGLTLTDGALEGINIWYEIRRGLALYKGLAPPPPEPNRTVFSRMRLAASVEDGVVTTRELVGELPFLTVNGSGAIDLGQSSVDLGLVATIHNAPELAKDPLAADLRGKRLPFRISGPLDDPGFAVDWKALLQSEATEMLLDKLGLAPKAAPQDGADGDQEPASSEDQLEDAAKSLLFDLLGGKGKDKDKDDGG